MTYKRQTQEGVREVVTKATEHGCRYFVLNIPSLLEFFLAATEEAVTQAFIGLLDHF